MYKRRKTIVAACEVGDGWGKRVRESFNIIIRAQCSYEEEKK